MGFFRMTDKIVLFSTCSDEKEAEKLARLLVDSRLAACVSVIPGIRSFYRWKGEVEISAECLLLIKSSRENFDALRERLEGAHSYEVPEVLALPVIAGSTKYMNWLDANLSSASKGQ